MNKNAFKSVGFLMQLWSRLASTLPDNTNAWFGGSRSMGGTFLNVQFGYNYHISGGEAAELYRPQQDHNTCPQSQKTAHRVLYLLE